jgi:HEAT repeat protein
MSDALQTALDSTDVRQAITFARILADLPAEQLPPILTTLANELASTSLARQRRAALVCSVLGPLASGLALALRNLLDSPRWAARESALHALARVDPDADTRTAAATCAVLDRSAAVRNAALELLAQHSEVPVVVLDALNHRHPRVRCRALRAVARLAPNDHVGTLAEALTHSHQRVRRTASELLGQLGALALPAVARLARCRCDGDASVASAARQALERLQAHLPDAFQPLYGSQNDSILLLDELLARAPEGVRHELDTVRQSRRERLPDRDARAEARWLVGRLVEMLTTVRSDSP